MATMTVPQVNPAAWSLTQLLKPEVLADPYPFYARLRVFEPVHWDAFLHSWVVTSYAEAVTVLTKYKAARAPKMESLEAAGLAELGPYVETMLRQVMFQDAPDHARLRGVCGAAFTPRRVESLRGHIQAIAEGLLDLAAERGSMEMVGDFAVLLPAMAMTAVLGIPLGDHTRLKELTAGYAELLGNFQHEPESIKRSIASLRELQRYFAEQVAEQRRVPREGLIGSLLAAEIAGARITEEEIVANAILVLTGGFEETSNLLGSAVLTLLQHPEALAAMRDDAGVTVSGVEELLRWESPTQHTGRIAPEDAVLGGKEIRKGQAVTVVLAAANRDPARFAEAETLDVRRTDNRHLAFGWAAHYCMGAPLLRLMAQVALPTLLRRLPQLRLVEERPMWRRNMGLRGLESLYVEFSACSSVLPFTSAPSFISAPSFEGAA